MRFAFVLAASLWAFPKTGVAAEQDPISFSKDVAPILQQHCQTCHRAGTGAPMSLITYEETRPWARSIRQRVLTREMPPWFIDKDVGVRHFRNDRSLTQQEIATIVKWVNDGAPRGTPSDLPPPRQFPNGQTWQVGKPDLILTLPEDLVMEAKGPDWWPVILVDTGLSEDRYLQAVQVIPTKGQAVIHHVRTALVGSEEVFFHEYALGKDADVFQEGFGRLIPAGTKINFQFHLHSIGTKTPTNVTLGFKFYPKGYVPRHVITWVPVTMKGIDLLPRERNVQSDVYTSLTKPARLLSFQPHIHSRGKTECLEAIYPNRTTELLTCAKLQSNWRLSQFNWHLNYVYTDDAAPLLPAGTILHSMMWHDATVQIKFNPDPDANTTWLSYYSLSDEEFRTELEARKTRAAAPKRGESHMDLRSTDAANHEQASSR